MWSVQDLPQARYSSLTTPAQGQAVSFLSARQAGTWTFYR